MEVDIYQQFTQFGLAGLMGVLWYMERRASLKRERELTESHDRLMIQQQELGELVGVVKDNTAALTAVERSQAQLVTVCDRIVTELRNKPAA